MKIAHTAKVTHNDIRPSNIIVNNDASQLHIIDWGLAQTIPSTACNVFGTLAYASSDLLLRNYVTPSERLDLESAAYVFLFLKKGNLPWHKAQAPKAVLDARAKISDPEVQRLLYVGAFW